MVSFWRAIPINETFQTIFLVVNKTYRSI